LGNRNGVEMKVVDGSLRIRSSRTAHAYIGRDASALTDSDGFVDSGDMVELRGGRYYFVGRRGGIINIGGLKVHPEEIEAVISRRAPEPAQIARQAPPLSGAAGPADSRRAVAPPAAPYDSAGRRGGSSSRGGLNVQPEEIEAVISRHPDMRMARAKSRRSPIT